MKGKGLEVMRISPSHAALPTVITLPPAGKVVVLSNRAWRGSSA